LNAAILDKTVIIMLHNALLQLKGRAEEGGREREEEGGGFCVLVFTTLIA
jgi:hypothetical protein